MILEIHPDPTPEERAAIELALRDFIQRSGRSLDRPGAELRSARYRYGWRHRVGAIVEKVDPYIHERKFKGWGQVARIESVSDGV